MANAHLIVSVIIALITVGIGAAYVSGALDPAIEKIGIMFFKAKATAEAKKLQAQGLKEGEDFVKSDLKGNQQAMDVKAGLGSVGGLKVGL
ncbi:hypothetical protein G7Y89_g5681 [Cudoniella acicularis]|uniref:Uncharacterized protein n=1 Tax=Cudoniella acicularis TaxID=354080 RepID=A0A8H4RP72_9HELO|nr:hypothetical protein G7Y89_g5681 [Cudoniella acicularis]